MNFLLDANVVSEWVKPTPHPQVVSWLANENEDHLYLSVVTFAEIRLGIELLPQGRRRTRLSQWLINDLAARFEERLLNIDRAIAEYCGLFMASWRGRGIQLGSMDALMAATAKVHDLVLVTRNIADFEQLEIRLFNPWQA